MTDKSKTITKNPFTKIFFVSIAIILVLYIGFLILFHRESITYSFDNNLIYRYFLSQDIPYEVPGKRLFLSDGEIHIASGYLYVAGGDPTEYNFQHPPFIKYLFGLSTLLTGNPYVVQFVFGFLLLCGVLVLSQLIFNSIVYGFMACVLLLLDPVFGSMLDEALLDLGQSVFVLFYVIVALFWSKKRMLQGVILGLLASAKFWAPALFFFVLIALFQWLKNKENIYYAFITLVIAMVVFCTFYLHTFLSTGFHFNIVLFQLKTLKYWLHHSVTSLPFASLILFASGYIKQWWGDRLFTRTEIWTPIWTLGLISLVYRCAKSIGCRVFDTSFFLVLIPILYLLYLGFQAPFPRYFILILPFMYLIFSHMVIYNLQIVRKRQIKTRPHNDVL